MSTRVVVATRNRHKVAELAELLASRHGGMELELVSLDEVGGGPHVVEDGETFEENARKKASEIAKACHMYALADDSGLEVDALGGEPGVYSARFAGAQADDARNNEKLLRALEGVPEEHRTARFRCVLALADPSGHVARTTHGTCEGRIALAPSGSAGFGYDPLFIPRDYTQTLGDLGDEVKQRISHRAAAATRMRELLESGLGT